MKDAINYGTSFATDTNQYYWASTAVANSTGGQCVSFRGKVRCNSNTQTTFGIRAVVEIDK